MASPSSEAPTRAELAWDEAARGYDDYFGPPFAPYLGAAVGALATRWRRAAASFRVAASSCRAPRDHQ
jgi:hypothetical protein